MRKLLLMLIPLWLIIGCQQDTEDFTEVEEEPSEEREYDDEPMNEVEVEEESENQGTTDDEIDIYMNQKMETLNFYEIEIEVEYMDGKEYEIEVEKEDEQPYEIKIKDDLNDIYLTGKQAFDELFPKIEQLQITNDSEQVNVIEQVLDIFDLPDNYTEFEIEIKFNDGSELDFDIKR